MAKKVKAKDDRIYQIKITLRGSKPPIWRRLELRADTPLDRLHAFVQIAMGWTDSHMHQFMVGGEHYGTPMGDDFMEMLDECKFTLGAIAPTPKKIVKYEYDFGDGWEHDVAIEKTLEVDPLAVYPRCVKGAGHCPPEDCGGIWGYYNMLAALKDPKHPEHAEFKEWLDRDFDPDAFDLACVNELLADFAKPRKGGNRGVWQFHG